MFFEGIWEGFPLFLFNGEGDVVRFQELLEVVREGFLDLLET